MGETSETLIYSGRFAAEPSELKVVRAAVQSGAVQAGCSEDEAADLVLAVDEACQNIIRHAYCGGTGTIELRMERDGDRIVAALRDYARPSDPRCLERNRDLDEVKPGGLGTHFMKSVMDEVTLVTLPDGKGNLLRMVKRLKRHVDRG